MSTSTDGDNLAAGNRDHLKHVNEDLYQRNAELAVRNKTLSLLRDLYGISIETLASEELGKKLVFAIRNKLDFDLVGLFVLNKKENELKPISFSFSDRMVARTPDLESILMSQALVLGRSESISSRAIMTAERQETTRLSDVWENSEMRSALKKAEDLSNIRSANLFPLFHDSDPLGLLLLSFNRTYADLSAFEQESIQSIVSVVTIALVKTELYDELRVANDRLQKLDKTKSEFLSIASHQLRTPISGIKGYLSMMIEGDFGAVEEKPKEILKSIYENTERLNGLVNDFLDVSRIERGKLVMERQPTDMAEMVKSIVDNFRPVASDKNLKLELVLSKVEPPKIDVDPTKLRQVILNLVDNAIKYTHEGSVVVNMEVLGDRLKVCVKDTGVGLEPEEAKNLFKPFVRATDASKSNATGSGLGLYVARKIVQYHGGKVWAESEGKGKGSNFCVEVPFDQGNVPEPEPEPYLE